MLPAYVARKAAAAEGQTDVTFGYFNRPLMRGRQRCVGKELVRQLHYFFIR